jgi:hypothetical protein
MKEKLMQALQSSSLDVTLAMTAQVKLAIESRIARERKVERLLLRALGVRG